MPYQQQCHISSLFLTAIFFIIINIHSGNNSCEGYNVVGSYHNNNNNNNLSIRPRQIGNIHSRRRQRHNKCNICAKLWTTSTCFRSMTIEPMDFINSVVSNGAVVTEDIIPLVIGTITTMVLFLLIPPSKLISTGDLYSIVTGTYLESNKNQLQCVYKASKDGWSAISFHNAVDGRGSGIVVAQTITGTIFGGYNPNGWRSTDDYYSSTAAFLWCYGKGKKIIKLPILPGGNCAIFDYATSGPCFGAADLFIGIPKAAIMGGFTGPDMEDISKSAGSLRQCKSSVGATYDYNNAWPIRGSARLSEVEVYCLK